MTKKMRCEALEKAEPLGPGKPNQPSRPSEFDLLSYAPGEELVSDPLPELAGNWPTPNRFSMLTEEGEPVASTWGGLNPTPRFKDSEAIEGIDPAKYFVDPTLSSRAMSHQEWLKIAATTPVTPLNSTLVDQIMRTFSIDS